MKKYILALGLVCGLANAQTTGIVKGSDVESKILRPAPASAPISKKEYEEKLKKEGKSMDSELKRVNANSDSNTNALVADDGFIKPGTPKTNQDHASVLGVPRVSADGKIDVNEAKRQQELQELDEAKKAAKLEGVPEGANAQYFAKMADEKLKKSLQVLFDSEKNMYSKKVVMNDYEKVEKQIQLMNILIDAQYSKEISRKADMVKVKGYFLMRQMISFILEDSIKGYRFTTLGENGKVLKVYSKSMNSKEVLGLKSITETAFSIGFEKVVFTDNNRYSLEENVEEYVQKLKAKMKSKDSK